MKRIYTTANGKQINLDALIAQNESTIAVGNMKVNARGDQLGPGGKIEVPKEQVMKEYYKLNTPTATDSTPQPHQVRKTRDLTDDWVEPLEEKEVAPAEEIKDSKPALRGSLADSVAKSKVNVDPVASKKSGPSRI